MRLPERPETIEELRRRLESKGVYVRLKLLSSNENFHPTDPLPNSLPVSQIWTPPCSAKNPGIPTGKGEPASSQGRSGHQATSSFLGPKPATAGNPSLTHFASPQEFCRPLRTDIRGIPRSNTDEFVDNTRSIGRLVSFRDIDFQDSGAFCHLSYCLDWLKDRQADVFPYRALLSAREALQIVHEMQARVNERRAWDFACSVSNVQGRTARTNVHRKFHPARLHATDSARFLHFIGTWHELPAA